MTAENIDRLDRLQKAIDKLKKSKEFLQLSQNTGDEMEMLALGYMEKTYTEIFNLKDDICQQDEL